jgi:hypothetical protein
MKKTFLVLALVALASVAASAKNYNISLAPYCDAFEISTSGTPLIYVGGIHDYSGCYGTSAYNLYVGGFRHSFYTSIDPGGSSTILDLTDPTFGYLEGLPYPVEFIFNTDQTCAWSIYADFTGTGHVLDNAGTCSFFTGAKAPKVAQGAPSSVKRLN